MGKIAWFSLVEMIFVMVIVAMLLAIMVPTLGGVIRGNAVSAGAQMIGGELRLARQQAAARRMHIAVLFPGAEAVGAGVPEKYGYQAYRVAEVGQITGESGYEFRGWPPGSQWMYLPQGASVLEVDADVGINDTGVPGAYSSQPADNSYTTVEHVDLAGIGGTGDVTVRSVIFSPSGRTRGTAKYITVGEANFVSGSWVIRNPVTVGEMATNESCRNQLSIVVNRFNGGILYRTPDRY